MNEYIKYLECKCGNEIIRASIDVYSEFDTDVNLAIYWNYYNNKLSWWKKIKYIYHMLKTGRVYEDCIILNPESAIELANFLKDSLEKKEYKC